MRDYFLKSENPLIRSIVDSDQGYTPLNLSDEDIVITTRTPAESRNIWRQKVLHGKYPAELENEVVDKEHSLTWLRRGQLYPETEGFIISIQDRVVRTRNYDKFILKKEITDQCRQCNKPGETIEHVIAGCAALADTAYLGRHNQIAKIIHIELARKYNLAENPPPYYKYSPEPVLESPEYLLYWDRPIITDRTVDHNRPDIVIIEKNNKKAVIIDIGCPLTHNLLKTERDKRTKYQNLAVELKHIWDLNTVDIVPIAISVYGVMTKNLRPNIHRLGLPKNLSHILQKSAILQTCHITRKFLNESG